MYLRVSIITHRRQERLRLDAPNTPEWTDRIKELAERKWSPTKRCWHIPNTKEAIAELETVFGDRLLLPQPLRKNEYEHRPIQWQSKDGQERFVVGDLIVVEQATDHYLAAYVPADKKQWIATIRGISGSRWKTAKRCWLLPYNKEAIGMLRNIEHVHFNLIVRNDIPEKAVTKTAKKTMSPPRAEQSNEMQKKALIAFEEHLMLERKSWRTVKSYKNILKGLFYNYPHTKPSQISAKQIATYLSKKIKDDHIAVSTHNQMINVFKAFYERLLEQPNKVKVERPKKVKQLPTVFSKQEIQQLLKKVDNLKHKAMLALIYSAGLRRGELLNLQCSDVLFDRKCLFIHQAKGDKDRYVLLSDQAAVLLKKYIGIYQPQYWLFEGQTKGRYSETSIQKVFDRAKETANLNARVTLHGLRHSFATHLLEDGVPLNIIREMLGHQSIKTREIYLHISNRYRRQIKSLLDSLDI